MAAPPDVALLRIACGTLELEWTRRPRGGGLLRARSRAHWLTRTLMELGSEGGSSRSGMGIGSAGAGREPIRGLAGIVEAPPCVRAPPSQGALLRMGMGLDDMRSASAITWLGFLPSADRVTRDKASADQAHRTDCGDMGEWNRPGAAAGPLAASASRTARVTSGWPANAAAGLRRQAANEERLPCGRKRARESILCGGCGRTQRPEADPRGRDRRRRAGAPCMSGRRPERLIWAACKVHSAQSAIQKGLSGSHGLRAAECKVLLLPSASPLVC